MGGTRKAHGDLSQFTSIVGRRIYLFSISVCGVVAALFLPLYCTTASTVSPWVGTFLSPPVPLLFAGDLDRLWELRVLRGRSSLFVLFFDCGGFPRARKFSPCGFSPFSMFLLVILVVVVVVVNVNTGQCVVKIR